MLLKKTQIFFNITIQEAEEMKNFFIKTKKRSYFSELFSLYKKNVNGAVLSAKIAFFLFISLVSFIVILLRQAFFEK
jgi:hypothetical protein